MRTPILVTGRYRIETGFFQFVAGTISVILPLEWPDLDAEPHLFTDDGFLDRRIKTLQRQIGFLGFGIRLLLERAHHQIKAGWRFRLRWRFADSIACWFGGRGRTIR